MHQKIDLGAEINKGLAMGKKSPLILTDTTEFEHLYPLKFSVLDHHPITDKMSQVLCDHFSKSTELKGHLEPSFLVDVTTRFENLIHTENDKEKEKAFNQEFSQFKSEMEAAIDQTVENIVKAQPGLAEHKKDLKNFIKNNMTCVSRVQLQDIAGIKVWPLFTNLEGERVLEVHHDLVDFIGSTGIYIGAVTMRRHVLAGMDLKKDVQYAVEPHTIATKGRDALKSNLFTLFYPTKEKFLSTAFFTRLSCVFTKASEIANTSRHDPAAIRQSTQASVENLSKIYDLKQLGIPRESLEARISEMATKPHMIVLGKSTMDLLNGLMNEISDEKWKEINEDPALSQVFQASLFKIREHLAQAELETENYNQFAQEIELVHAELATLLELVRPFQEKDFDDIYRETLQTVMPKEAKCLLQTGLGKTAVNIFSGINAAVFGNNPQAERVYSEGLYFEQAGIIGSKHTFDDMKRDPNAKKVDLYVGQFNPNIEIEPQYTKYQRRDIVADLKYLFENNKAADHLTVAIDCTIDRLDSPNVKELLETYKKEIAAGRLNCIFFRSGQKLDMLGMDNYYGAPFFMVNNGEPQWDAFKQLQENPVHKTDPLSTQWFCLANKYAHDSMKKYRELIFQNTRYVLDRIPGALRPSNNPKQKLRVNEADERMDACFFDIKVLGKMHKVRSYFLIGSFYDMMMKRGIKTHSRASFGFYHPNAIVISVNEIEGASSIRINPGLNPQENDALVAYFQSLEK